MFDCLVEFHTSHAYSDTKMTYQGLNIYKCFPKLGMTCYATNLIGSSRADLKTCRVFGLSAPLTCLAAINFARKEALKMHILLLPFMCPV